MPHPVRVAIDGVDAAGKTTLADELAQQSVFAQRQVIRASIDGFHFPKGRRYARGTLSPEGYFLDSFDAGTVCALLLEPLGPGGSLEYVARVSDFRTDQPVKESPRRACASGLLLFDGVFLLRPELRAHWDFRVFVHADFSVTLRRAVKRDVDLFRSVGAIEQRYACRYIPGQKLYLASCNPMAAADVVLDNNNPNAPVLLKRSDV